MARQCSCPSLALNGSVEVSSRWLLAPMSCSRGEQGNRFQAKLSVFQVTPPGDPKRSRRQKGGSLNRVTSGYGPRRDLSELPRTSLSQSSTLSVGAQSQA